ncbi:hypothetical protein ACWGPD_13230 [Streptomyces hirsutus]|uniref:hypothetical protein n=1 Tax=Streptomyces hirsutus TaxID=35620 RepID=UPI003326044C
MAGLFDQLDDRPVRQAVPVHEAGPVPDGPVNDGTRVLALLTQCREVLVPPGTVTVLTLLQHRHVVSSMAAGSSALGNHR